MSSAKQPRNSGFTIVELLVVIAILAALAALSYSIGIKMIAKGKATKQMEDVRQIGQILTVYGADHGMKLPPAKAPTLLPDGSTKEVQWTEQCLSIAFPDTDITEFRVKSWWDKNDNFMRNPLFKETAKPRGWEPLNPGYGLNEMIAENLAIASTGSAPSHPELDLISTPLATLGEPSRTPVVAPCDNYYFRYDPDQLKTFDNSTLKDFLSNDKIPVLFVDGHVEPISPTEYEARKLYLVPIVPVP